jgi:hypothetical protein
MSFAPKTNPEGNYEVQATFKLTFDPQRYGFTNDEHDLINLFLSRVLLNGGATEIEIVED